MLSDEEIAQLFIEARDSGHINTFKNYADCNSACDHCPADPACQQLAKIDRSSDELAVVTAEREYAKFKRLYNRDILPLLPEDEEVTA